MIRFGFSAYLKLICLEDRPQKTELRKRRDSLEDPYDYHRSLRLRIRRLLRGEPPDAVMASLTNIKKDPERRSATDGLEKLLVWRSSPIGSGVTAACSSATYTSPNEIFRVTYNPDFSIDIGGVRTAVHVWNTMKPDLIDNFVFGTLALFPSLYAENAPADFAVLSLRDNRLYRLSEVSAGLAVLGPQIAELLERRINEVWAEDDRRPAADDRPAASL